MAHHPRQGGNPTFGENARTLEAHLFDFDGDLYGRRCRVALIERIRGEIAFTGVEALVAQIRRDADEARVILARGPSDRTPHDSSRSAGR